MIFFTYLYMIEEIILFKTIYLDPISSKKYKLGSFFSQSCFKETDLIIFKEGNCFLPLAVFVQVNFSLNRQNDFTTLLLTICITRRIFAAWKRFKMSNFINLRSQIYTWKFQLNIRLSRYWNDIQRAFCLATILATQSRH